MNGMLGTYPVDVQGASQDDGMARLIARLQHELEQIQAQIHLSAANLEGLHSNAEHLFKTVRYLREQNEPQSRPLSPQTP